MRSITLPVLGAALLAAGAGHAMPARQPSASLAANAVGAQADVPNVSAAPLPEAYGLVDVWPPEVSTGALLYHPTGIAVDAHGRVVVVEAGNGRVTRASTTGLGFVPNEPPVRFGRPGSAEGELAAPEDIAVTAEGDRIYVADTGNRRVQVFGPTGAVLAVWDDVGHPRGIALGPGPALEPGGSPVADGRVYVSDARHNVVRVLTAEGAQVAAWDAGGAAGLDTPLGLTVDPEGDLVLADHGHQRLVWLDADGSEGPAGAVVGILPLDNAAGPGGAPLDVGVDLGGDVYAAVDRAILRFRSGAAGEAGGTGRASDLAFGSAVPPVAEIIGPPCDPGACVPRNPVAFGCYRRVPEPGSHEGVQRIDLRPDVGLYATFAPETRAFDRVMVYPALRGGAPGGITRPDDQNVIVWPRLCRDVGGPSRRHTTDPERIEAAPDDYGARTLDTSAELHVWHADGSWFDAARGFPVTTGEDLAVSRALPAVTGIVTGNQIRLYTLRCNSGTGDDVCPPDHLDVLDARQLLRRDRTSACRRAQPIPWRPSDPGPCIPDERWWIVAASASGGTIVRTTRDGIDINAPHALTFAALDAGGQRSVLRTLWVEPNVGEQILLAGEVRLAATTAPFRAWSDLAYDAAGRLWALARSGSLRVIDDRGRSLGELVLDGLAPRTAESLGIDADGSLFVLTGDGWVMKFAPFVARVPTPTPSATPTTDPTRRPPPRITPRRTATPTPTLPTRAVLRAAWKVADLAGPGRYRDLAVDADGRVLVPDADGDRVLVFGPSASTPQPPPPASNGGCHLVPDKVAAPSRLTLGETTDVTLRLEGGCDRAPRDIVVVLDASCQLGGERLRHAREALAALARALVEPGDRVGVVTFNADLGDARLALPLTEDRAAVERYAAAFRTDCRMDQACVLARQQVLHVGTFLWPYGCTTEGRIADGLRAGRDALVGPAGRPEAPKALVLVSSSQLDAQRTLAILAQNPDTFDPPFSPDEQATWEAERAAVYPIPAQGDRELALHEGWRLRDAGVEVWAVGIGVDAFGFGHPPDDALLAALASPADRYAPAQAPADLTAVLTRIGGSLSERVAMASVVVTDRIPANMALVQGSVRPPATVMPDGELRWSLPGGSAFPDLVFTLRPLASGRWPTNVEAAAAFTDTLGRAARVVFPVPEVEVLAPSSATPSATPSASPTPVATVAPTDEPTPSPDPPPTPTDAVPTPTGAPPPPTARPTPAALRDIYLPFAQRTGCRRVPRPVDVVLLVDTSSSMAGAKLAAAKLAAETFLGQLDLRPGGDRAALIGFDATADVAQPLTGDRAALTAAVGGLATAVGTRLDLGLVEAAAELTGPRARGGADRAIVLLTDGRPQGGTEAAVLSAAATARATGGGVWAVGLGGDVLVDVLEQITADRSRVHLAPGSGELAAIYRAIASGIVCR